MTGYLGNESDMTVVAYAPPPQEAAPLMTLGSHELSPSDQITKSIEQSGIPVAPEFAQIIASYPPNVQRIIAESLNGGAANALHAAASEGKASPTGVKEVDDIIARVAEERRKQIEAEKQMSTMFGMGNIGAVFGGGGSVAYTGSGLLNLGEKEEQSKSFMDQPINPLGGASALGGAIPVLSTLAPSLHVPVSDLNFLKPDNTPTTAVVQERKAAAGLFV